MKPRGLAAAALLGGALALTGCEKNDCDLADTNNIGDSGSVDTTVLDEAIANLSWAARNNGGEPPLAEENFDISPRFISSGSGHEATAQVRGQSNVVLSPEEEGMVGILIEGTRGAQSVEDFLWDAANVGGVTWEQGENHTVVWTDALNQALAESTEATFIICGDECRVVVGFSPEGSEDEHFGAEFTLTDEGAALME